ncbi:hypothetical protein DOY81_011383 [Sarcophaga bullata]|nr:hypothetical protein DOY81_011383 [Sarcophaga bullata]
MGKSFTFDKQLKVRYTTSLKTITNNALHFDMSWRNSMKPINMVHLTQGRISSVPLVETQLKQPMDFVRVLLLCQELGSLQTKVLHGSYALQRRHVRLCFDFGPTSVYEAEKFDYDVWSKTSCTKRNTRYPLQGLRPLIKNKDISNNDYYYFYTQDWKMWQWWKMMGLGEHWYSEDRFMLRENMDNTTRIPNTWKSSKELKCSSCLLTTPVILNSTTRNPPCLTSLKMLFERLLTFGLNKDRRGEYWLYNVRQCCLVTTWNVCLWLWVKSLNSPSSIRLNTVRSPIDQLQRCWFLLPQELLRIEKLRQIRLPLTRSWTSSTVWMKSSPKVSMSPTMANPLIYANPNPFEYIWPTFNCKAMLTLSTNTSSNTGTCTPICTFGDVDKYDFEAFPNVFLNYETMMRDPLFYMFYKKIATVYFRFQQYMKPYTHEELLFPGVTIRTLRSANWLPTSIWLTLMSPTC